MSLLSIIIVNYRSQEDIEKCLESAFRYPSAKDFEWLIVNNETGYVPPESFTSAYPGVRWIHMDHNSGFARANNAGIKEAKGETFLLLNPDTIVVDDAIQKCHERLLSTNIVAASVQLLNEDGSPQITGNYFMKGGLNHLLPLPYLGGLLRRIALAGKIKKTNIPQATGTMEADWINGAFIMVKKEAVQKAGMLDEDFFLYYEEIEWCHRLGKVGKIVVYGDLFCYHLQGATVNRITGTKEKGYTSLTGKKGLQLMVSQHLRIKKQFGNFWFAVHLLAHTIEIPVFQAGNLIENIFKGQNPFRGQKSVAQYVHNVYKLWKLAPAILSGKPHFYKIL